MEDLVSESQLKEAHYKIVYIESPDEWGIDVAFLYDSHIFTVDSQEAVQPDLSVFKNKSGCTARRWNSRIIRKASLNCNLLT